MQIQLRKHHYSLFLGGGVREGAGEHGIFYPVLTHAHQTGTDIPPPHPAPLQIELLLILPLLAASLLSTATAAVAQRKG